MKYLIIWFIVTSLIPREYPRLTLENEAPAYTGYEIVVTLEEVKSIIRRHSDAYKIYLFELPTGKEIKWWEKKIPIKREITDYEIEIIIDNP